MLQSILGGVGSLLGSAGGGAGGPVASGPVNFGDVNFAPTPKAVAASTAAKWPLVIVGLVVAAVVVIGGALLLKRSR